MTNTAEELANQHWSYVEDLLKVHGEKENVIEKLRFHYVTAFQHGYKHSKEELK